MKIRFFSLLLFSALFLSACADNAKVGIRNMSVAEFEKVIQNKKVQLVDVRTPEEYAKGHIDGSINIDVLDDETFDASVNELLDKDEWVALYCRSGRRSTKAAELLKEAGFKIYHLDNGILQWLKEGKDTTSITKN